jgi:uncharacterized protein YdiU (UPF0061 family)
MGLGFVHGVMNTDNTTISGETIDYGPCAFMDQYDPATVFSSIDHTGRYAYGNQPDIIIWNLARLAEALLPLIDPSEDHAIAQASAVIGGLRDIYQREWLAVFGRKLGLDTPDLALTEGLHQLWAGQGVDFTSFFRALPAALDGDDTALRALFADASGLAEWLAEYRAKASSDTPARVAALNPIYIPRNHLVEEALFAASFRDDMGPFQALLARLQDPFRAVDGADRYAAPPPRDVAPVVTYCGT